MPNLVGIGNSQAPTNAMLGGLAYEDSSILYEVRSGRKNLIINGDMRINQRYGTSSSTEKDRITIDRWRESNPGASNMTHQTVSDGPPGFEYSEKMTNGGSSYSVSSTQTFYFQQTIEANNVGQLQLGQSTAKNYTVSFWVKSSLTGQFSIASGNTTQGGYATSNYTTRTYVSSYQINDANTWEYKTVTFPGDTSGTWLRSGTGGGLSIIFDLGAGSTHEGTPGQWNSNNDFRMPGSMRMGPTASSTWQITGVQLEEGNIATSFERRPIAEELTLCMRYYEGVYMTTGTAAMPSYSSYGGSTNFEYQFKVEKRSQPTFSLEGDASWTGATPTAFPSKSNCMFQHNAGTLFRLSDGSQDLCASFDAEI